MRRRNPILAKRQLARHLRRLSLARSWSQDDLAVAASAHEALISAMEVGGANPTLQSVRAVDQLLDRDSRMIDLTLRDQVVQYLRRPILHLIDIDASIEQQECPAVRLALTNGSSLSLRRARFLPDRTAPNGAPRQSRIPPH